MGTVTMRNIGVLALAFLLSSAVFAQPAKRFDPEAVRLNNRGVALMGQQSTGAALEAFTAAFKKDPSFSQAAINEGIALLALQRLDTSKQVLRQAITIDPNSAQAWYNLGLVQ